VYLTGTKDPENRNFDVLPLDVQAWSVLAMPSVVQTHPEVLNNALRDHLTLTDGVFGLDYNSDLDGAWFEGMGQMAVALESVGRTADAEAIRRELRRAQQTSPLGNKYGIVAASHDGVTTGFNFKYFQRLHVGATAWLVFAQLQDFNPFVDS
jgi:hypothetical protein